MMMKRLIADSRKNKLNELDEEQPGEKIVGIKSGKIWGNTECLVQNSFVEFHRIEIVKDGYCSLHSHNFKWNVFYVVEGQLEIEVHKTDYDLIDKTIIGPGEITTVKPGEFHKFHALTDVIAFEIYHPEPLSDDIIRQTVGGIPK